MAEYNERKTIKVHHSSYKSLQNLLENNSFKTQKNCVYTNITNQEIGSTYAIPCFYRTTVDDFRIEYKNNINIVNGSDCLDKFFEYIEKCRLYRIYLNYSEKQTFSVNKNNIVNAYNDIKISKSCIEYDFDIYLKNKQKFDDDFYGYIIECIAYTIAEVIDLDSCTNEYKEFHKFDGSKINNIHFCILNKNQREINSQDNYIYKKYGICFKESFHIRIFTKITKEAKIFIRKKTLENETFVKIFTTNKNILNDVDNIFDKAACSYPAMILGSMKKGGNEPHEFYKLYKIRFRNNIKESIVEDNYEYEEIKIKKKKGRTNIETTINQPIINICYDISLNFENHKGKIKKPSFCVKSKYESMIINYTERDNNNGISTVNLKQLDRDIENLKNNDIDAEYIIKILNILKIERVSDFSEWRKIIYILATKGNDYKNIAISFSLRSGNQFENGGLKIIDGIFENYYLKNMNQDDENIDYDFKDLFSKTQLTVKTLYYWAKQDNPEQYERIRLTNYNQIITGYLHNAIGHLRDTHIADIIKAILQHKYITLRKTTTVQGNDICSGFIWYKFVENHNSKNFSMYKWKRIEQNQDLFDYVNKKFTGILSGMSDIMKEELTSLKNIDNDDIDSDTIDITTKYLQNKISILANTINKCGDRAFIESVVKSCKLMFIRKDIDESDVDNYKNYIGVKNGILKLYPTTEFIDSYHNILITHSTNANYIKYNSNNIYIQRLEQVFKEIFDNNIESYEFFMMFLASGLDDREKNPQTLFILQGVGSQGKSVLSEFHQLTFGNTNNKGCPGYTAKIPTEWLCTSRSASGPDSTVASLKGARSIFVSEIESGAEFNAAKVKEMLSERISYNQKFKEQDTMKINANIVSTNNASPKISEVDYGSVRRFKFLKLKNTYYEENSNEYNSENPNHKIANKDIMNKWKHDINYQNAYLSIMVNFYEKFRDEYNYDIGKIPHTQIIEETEDYFERQDPIAKFIKCKMIFVGDKYPVTGKNVESIPIKDIYDVYKKWFTVEYGELKGHKVEHCNNFEKNYKIHNNLCVNRINGDNVTFLKGYVLVEYDENYDTVYENIFDVDHILNNSVDSSPVDNQLTILNNCIKTQENILQNIKTEINQLQSQQQKLVNHRQLLLNKKNELIYSSIDI